MSRCGKERPDDLDSHKCAAPYNIVSTGVFACRTKGCQLLSQLWTHKAREAYLQPSVSAALT